jgi:hypothetical protein
MSFQLDGVLKEAVNWFLVTPAAGSGALPTITPIDTRSATSNALKVGVARSTDVEGIFLNLGTDLGLGRAQVVLRVVDSQNRSVTGVKAALTAEVTAYRMAGAWVKDGAGTDDSGMIFLGNVQAGSAITTVTVALSGAASARVDVAIMAGATTVVTAIVTAK